MQMREYRGTLMMKPPNERKIKDKEYRCGDGAV